jgi:hypothetical protein
VNKSSNHTLSLHRMTSNSFSTSTQLLCGFVFPFFWLNFDLILATGCYYTNSAWTQRKTQPVLLMKLVYRSVAQQYTSYCWVLVYCGVMFTGPLPSNGSIRHSMLKNLVSLITEAIINSQSQFINLNIENRNMLLIVSNRSIEERLLSTRPHNKIP